jgi:cytochrome P450
LNVGPVVRIGPNELDFSDVSAAREIHKVGAGYLKSNWYRKLGYQGSETLFSTTNPRFHAERRRLLSGPISEQNLLRMEPIINQRIYMTIARIEEEIEKTGAADIFKWWTFMATDVIGELSFGESFRMLELGKVIMYPGHDGEIHANEDRKRNILPTCKTSPDSWLSAQSSPSSK